MEKVICDICGNEIIFESSRTYTSAPQDVPDANELLNEILLNTREQCTMVDSLIRNQIAIKDNQIDKLYNELQFYKDDYSSRFINQVMKAVIKVRKDMLKLVSSPKWDILSAEQLQREYEYTLDDLTDLLEQQNIDPYETAAGEQFDAAIHQVHKLIPTDDKALDRTIKECVSEGYIQNGKILIVERVNVYQYKVL